MVRKSVWWSSKACWSAAQLASPPYLSQLGRDIFVLNPGFLEGSKLPGEERQGRRGIRGLVQGLPDDLQDVVEQSALHLTLDLASSLAMLKYGMIGSKEVDEVSERDSEVGEVMAAASDLASYLMRRWMV